MNAYEYIYIYKGIFNYGRIKHHKSILLRGLGGLLLPFCLGFFFKDTVTLCLIQLEKKYFETPNSTSSKNNEVCAALGTTICW